MLDRKTLGIVLLSVTGTLLAVANLQLNSVAKADVAVWDNDYEIVTGLTQRSDDGLYILDRRRNLIAYFTWDSNKRGIMPREVQSLDRVMGVR